jgi:hypothetical protein
MKSRSQVCAAALLAAAGSAFAAPTLDGTLDAGFYGPVLWVQNQATGFGDNHPDNVPPPGNPGQVNRGIELVIPLAALGNPTAGNLRLAGCVASGSQDFLSNQVVGGLPGLQGNLGDPRNINFQNITTPTNQWAGLNPAAVGTAPTVDGTLDGTYGGAKFTQTTFTEFGDATHGTRFFGSGSEIDGIYAVTNGGNLYLFIAGNLEANGNRLTLFFDTDGGGTAGQNRLLSSNPSSGNLTRMGDDGSGNGLTFDSNFDCDYAVVINGVDSNPDENIQTYACYVDFAQTPTAGGGLGYFCGTGDGATPTLSGGDVGAPAIGIAVDNSNAQGVTGTPPFTIPSPDFAVGSELDNLYAKVEGSKLYVFMGGNLQTNYNKIALFIDVGVASPGRPNDPGQHTLRGDNVDMDFNGLNRMGTSQTQPGLTFDTGFAADNIIAITNGGITPVQNYVNSAVLRADGPIKDQGTGQFNFDYGSFDGGDKATNNPCSMNGPRVDLPGTTVQIYSNYSPRLSEIAAEQDPNNPLPPPDMIRFSINNSNIAGVSGNSIDGAADVTTGIEVEVDLAELGWTEGNPIKIAGWVASGGYDFISNQVIGGLPATNNLGEARLVDLSTIAGDQFVVVGDSGCPADFNGDNQVDFFDYLDFVQAFNDETAAADFNGDNQVDFFDYLDFAQAFDTPCE